LYPESGRVPIVIGEVTAVFLSAERREVYDEADEPGVEQDGELDVDEEGELERRGVRDPSAWA